jgi:nucleotide-binding universal stress UspA family protein
MFNTIVCGTDGSEHADRAVRYARALAQQFDSELVLVHCLEYVATRVGGGPVYANEGELEGKIRSQAAELQGEGINATVTIAGGRPESAGHVIADTAREVNADLIVVGTRGHSAVAGLLLGSVTQRLLHVAPCPVLAVPPVGSGG